MNKWLNIIGCGPGSKKYVTAEAVEVIENAEAVLGTKRLLELFEIKVPVVETSGNYKQAISELEKLSSLSRVAYLVSGDPGMRSMASALVKYFGFEKCNIIPGISSVQLAFAKTGLDWYHARILSAHGETPDADISTLSKETCIAVLAGRVEAIQWAKDLYEKLSFTKFILCENLGLEAERIREISVKELRPEEVESLAIILMLKEN